jgi:DNA-binding winged helix-turn-helix (wHTH) protein/Tfp pilus assembly protein PilF
VFSVDFAQRELRKQGVRLRLADQPFAILGMLTERAGEIVTREELRLRLWPADTFVDFENGLNNAVKRLRNALGDEAENPRYIETVPRRGYRFIYPVTAADKEARGPAAVPEVYAAGGAGMPDAVVRPAANRSLSPGAVAKRNWRVVGAVTALVCIVGAAGAYWFRRSTAFSFTAKDTVVLADFQNSTGETVFDDALRQGLVVGLEQSPFVKILPERRASVILKQMGHAPDERVVGPLAVELCQRTGSKVAVQGSIATLGTTYLIGLAAIRCDNAKLIANEQVQAQRKEDVVDALGVATAQLRARLGESLPSIQKFNAPLEQATTPSLEALNTYGVALATWDRKGDVPSIPLFKRAIELDPNFAMAYGALAVVYHNRGETGLARENATASYALRARVTEAERATIESRYYLYVTEELEKAAQVYEARLKDYPDAANTVNHLGSTETSLGHNEKAVEVYRRAMQLDATRVTTYINLAWALVRLERFAEAQTVLAQAEQRGFHTDHLVQVNYVLGFLQGDSERMARAQREAASVPGAQALLLATEAETEAYYGRFAKAREISEQAAALMTKEGDQESAADCLALAALREAEVGRPAEARELLGRAQKIGHERVVLTLGALVNAEAGDAKSALATAAQLDQEYPHSTFLQHYWLPLIRAQAELRKGHGEKAVSLLEAALPMDTGVLYDGLAGEAYPDYVRGEAYLASGDGNRAATEFQKILEHRGMALNSPLAALARLGSARAYARIGDKDKARAEHQEFLRLWKDGDAGIPALLQARAELQSLR